MKKQTPPINRDLGTKRACIAELRKSIAAATVALDGGNIHTAIHILELKCQALKEGMPREKAVKPFKG